MPEITGRLRTPRVSAAPATPVAGEMYYDTTANILYWWNGTIWVAASGGAAAGNTYAINQAAHGLALGNLVRYSGAAYVKALADIPDNAEVVGIVSAVADANNFTLLVVGQVTGLSGLTAGSTYFLSDTTAGLLTLTEPTTAGRVSKPVGVALSTTAIYFFNMRGAVVGPTPKVTASAWSGAAPAGANDGDIWMATGGGGGAAPWQFRYNAGSASAYRWEFVGGPPVLIQVDAFEGTASLWGTVVDLATAGPNWTPAHAGDYSYSFTARVRNSVANGAAIAVVSYFNGSAWIQDALAMMDQNAANMDSSLGGQGFFAGVPNGGSILVRYCALNGGTASFQNRRLSVWPVRVS